MEKSMDILRVGNDNSIDIKDLPQEKISQIDPQHLKLLDEEKVIGGIFNETSIRLKRGTKKNYSFSLDTVEGTVQDTTKKGRNSNGGGDDGMGDLERRVENLEFNTKKIQEQLESVKEDTLTTKMKFDGIVTKADILQLQATLTQTIQDSIKPLPSENDVKVIINEVIKSNEIPDQTKVENMIDKSQRSLVKWIIATGLTTIGATVTIIRLFL
ncbi:hypothetical protein MHI57_18170 [Cytobacillus sp. FSL K6-0129]|uniref:hypothetical protein n=1 Tax=Cytobacillus sp. FSL K6-0129 TaxID=2921421 RepID=UPI0030F93321